MHVRDRGGGQALPEPEVIGCLFDDAFAPPLAVMRLAWPAAVGPRVWDMPGSVRLVGPPPERFGLRVQRRDADCYSVCLVWDRCSFLWPALSRGEVLGTSLAPLPAAMGTDLPSCQERFKSPSVQAEDHLRTVLRDLDRNPAGAGPTTGSTTCGAFVGGRGADRCAPPKDGSRGRFSHDGPPTGKGLQPIGGGPGRRRERRGRQALGFRRRRVTAPVCHVPTLLAHALKNTRS